MITMEVAWIMPSITSIVTISVEDIGVLFSHKLFALVTPFFNRLIINDLLWLPCHPLKYQITHKVMPVLDYKSIEEGLGLNEHNTQVKAVFLNRWIKYQLSHKEVRTQQKVVMEARVLTKVITTQKLKQFEQVRKLKKDAFAKLQNNVLHRMKPSFYESSPHEAIFSTDENHNTVTMIFTDSGITVITVKSRSKVRELTNYDECIEPSFKKDKFDATRKIKSNPYTTSKEDQVAKRLVNGERKVGWSLDRQKTNDYEDGSTLVPSDQLLRNQCIRNSLHAKHKVAAELIVDHEELKAIESTDHKEHNELAITQETEVKAKFLNRWMEYLFARQQQKLLIEARVLPKKLEDEEPVRELKVDAFPSLLVDTKLEVGLDVDLRKTNDYEDGSTLVTSDQLPLNQCIRNRLLAKHKVAAELIVDHEELKAIESTDDKEHNDLAITPETKVKVKFLIRWMEYQLARKRQRFLMEGKALTRL